MTEKARKVVVDLTVCQGYANCVSAAPTVFDLDQKSGLARVLIEDPPADLTEVVEEAIALCPVRAISRDEAPS